MNFINLEIIRELKSYKRVLYYYVASFINKKIKKFMIFIHLEIIGEEKYIYFFF